MYQKLLIGGNTMPSGYKLHSNDPVKSLDNIRPLTTLERAEIQTFPSDFMWTGKKTNVEQMIGNAVPVKLAQFVGNAIMMYIKEHSVSEVISTNGNMPMVIQRACAV